MAEEEVKGGENGTTALDSQAKNEKPPVPRVGRRKPPKNSTRKSTAVVTIPETRRRGPGRSPKYPWETIREEFIGGQDAADGKSITLPTLKELAEKYEAPYGLVRERSSKERWTDRRQQRQTELALERQKKRTRDMAKKAGEFDDRAYVAANIGVGLVIQRLGEITREAGVRSPMIEQALQDLKDGMPVDKLSLWSAVNYKEMEGLASALDRFQQIGMRALGTDVLRHEITSPDGSIGPSTTINITNELGRDDPDRLAGILTAMHDANLVDLSHLFAEENNIIDVEEVEDDESA